MATDTTDKIHNSFTTRISVNFFVPPSLNESNKKLYSAAQKWMGKMAESDKKMLYSLGMTAIWGGDTIRNYKDILTSLFLFKNTSRDLTSTRKVERFILTSFFCTRSRSRKLKGTWAGGYGKKRLISTWKRYNLKLRHDLIGCCFRLGRFTSKL